MSNPFDSFQQGLMTGNQMGTQFRERRNARELGGLMSSGNIEGARNLAYTQGDLQTGQALDGRVQQQAEQQRGQNIVGALKTNDYAGAMNFANTPEELQAITQFKESATEQDLAAAAQRSEQMAMVVGSIQSLPPEQQLQAAQAAAAQFGMDPQSITPDMVTPQALERLRMQSLGLKDYLTFQDRTADNQRQEQVAQAQITAAEALADQRRVSANVSQSREARQPQPRARGGGGGSRPHSAPAAATPSRRPWERF